MFCHLTAANFYRVVYISYLVFQLFSHKDLYRDDNPNNFQSTQYPKRDHNKYRRKFNKAIGKKPKPDEEKAGDSTTLNGTADPTANGDAHDVVSEGTHTVASDGTVQEEEEEQPILTVPMTIGLLVFVTVVSRRVHIIPPYLICSGQIVAVTAEFLVDSIDGLTSTGKISKEFVGLVLLPIVGNAAGSCNSHQYMLWFLTYSDFRTRNCGHGVCQRQDRPESGCRCGLQYSKQRQSISRIQYRLTDV